MCSSMIMRTKLCEVHPNTQPLDVSVTEFPLKVELPSPRLSSHLDFVPRYRPGTDEIVPHPPR